MIDRIKTFFGSGDGIEMTPVGEAPAKERSFWKTAVMGGMLAVMAFNVAGGALAQSIEPDLHGNPSAITATLNQQMIDNVEKSLKDIDDGTLFMMNQDAIDAKAYKVAADSASGLDSLEQVIIQENGIKADSLPNLMVARAKVASELMSEKTGLDVKPEKVFWQVYDAFYANNGKGESLQINKDLDGNGQADLNIVILAEGKQEEAIFGSLNHHQFQDLIDSGQIKLADSESKTVTLYHEVGHFIDKVKNLMPQISKDMSGKEDAFVRHKTETFADTFGTLMATKMSGSTSIMESQLQMRVLYAKYMSSLLDAKFGQDKSDWGGDAGAVYYTADGIQKAIEFAKTHDLSSMSVDEIAAVSKSITNEAVGSVTYDQFHEFSQSLKDGTFTQIDNPLAKSIAEKISVVESQTLSAEAKQVMSEKMLALKSDSVDGFISDNFAARKDNIDSGDTQAWKQIFNNTKFMYSGGSESDMVSSISEVKDTLRELHQKGEFSSEELALNLHDMSDYLAGSYNRNLSEGQATLLAEMQHHKDVILDHMLSLKGVMPADHDATSVAGLQTSGQVTDLLPKYESDTHVLHFSSDLRTVMVKTKPQFGDDMPKLDNPVDHALVQKLGDGSVKKEYFADGHKLSPAEFVARQSPDTEPKLKA